MDLGFETIGNACLIVHDRGPVLATDPWLTGTAYFGSWRLSHAVPAEQQANVARCRYLWLSHGHPDHLSLESLERLRDKTILLPDHHGGRIARDLRGLGFTVQVLPCGQWFPVSDRVRIASLANYNQDATLVMEVDGHLIIDANDAGNRGSGRFLDRERHRFHKRTVLACLTGYGDADMINFVDEQGRRVPPLAAQKIPCGPGIKATLDYYDLDIFAPSSAMHRYNRTDSGWADEYATPIDAHGIDFDGGRRTLLPAFVQYDLHTGSYEKIDPPANDGPLQDPAVFGDDWTTPLDAEDVKALRAYFTSFEHLHSVLGFLNFRVGGKDHVIDIAPGQERGITFATPRQSLLAAVSWQAFDDILIGNFCQTTMHGDWWGKVGAEALYPHFTPFVTKFGDNGGCRTAAELRGYFAEYLRRGFTEFTADRSEQEMRQALLAYL
ncbi:MAG: MBL fold metallo-hydrolase [Planctomycetes bacterium]|nr:MBL fold metallo-hydrolase [Planctomycetota bacterium]MCC7397163.1 MBL fold metallo-hydrolase [Planctomycetota bacterium]